jgi:hypothetical protein
MNKRFDNPNFYNHVFYPKRAWIAVAPFVFGMALAIGAIFFWNYINPRESLSWQIRTVAAVLALMFMIPLLIFRVRQLKKIQIGVGPGGLYLRGYGLLTWSEIEKMQMWQHDRHGKSIKITTYAPAQQGDELSRSSSAKRTLFDAFGESLDEMFIVGGEFISIPLEELLSLLQEYHKEYQADDDSNTSAFSSSTPTVIHIHSNGLPSWIVRIGIVMLFFLALIAVVLLKGGLEGLWITLGIGAFAATFLFFNKLHLFLEIIVLVFALGLIAFGIGSFVHEMVTHNKLMMQALLGAGGGLFLLVLLILARRRNKKIQK